MKDYYETQIKPQNTELGRSLGVKSIDVSQKRELSQIPVNGKVWIKTGENTRMHVTISQYNTYEALGLIFQ